jgi:hypothetical protein
MIRNEAELTQTIEQVNRMYRVLADLRARIEPANPQNFRVFAEGPIDEIKRMRADIDAYLGITADSSPASAEISAS